jgi:hypothetical protein
VHANFSSFLHGCSVLLAWTVLYLFIVHGLLPVDLLLISCLALALSWCPVGASKRALICRTFHSPDVVAVATGQPGEYRGALELEMAGVWAVQVDIDKPLRDRVVVRLQAEECPQGQARCVVQPAGGKP